MDRVRECNEPIRRRGVASGGDDESEAANKSTIQKKNLQRERVSCAL